MKQTIRQKTISLLLLCGISAAGLLGCQKPAESKTASIDSTKITVAATLFPYYDFARAVAGDLVDLHLILPPGQESHSFEPTASELITMEEADILLYNGGESEQWVSRVLETGNGSSRLTLAGMDVVSLREEEASENMKGHDHDHDHEDGDHDHDDNSRHEDGHEEDDHEASDPAETTETNEEENSSSEVDGRVGTAVEYDEHIWTSPVNAIRLTEAIRDILIEAAPEYQEEFTKNAADYIAQLQDIDAEFREIAADGKTDLLIFADRFPFLYFVREYGFRYDAAFSGCSSDTEPSAAVLAGLIDRIEDEAIPAVFHVEQSSQKTAAIIQEATGVAVLEFHSCHNVTKQELEDGVTYVDLMRRNEEALKIALGEKD